MPHATIDTAIDAGARHLREAAGFGWTPWGQASPRVQRAWRDAALAAARFLRTHRGVLDGDDIDVLAGLVHDTVGLCPQSWRHNLCEDQHRWLTAAHTAHDHWHALRRVQAAASPGASTFCRTFTRGTLSRFTSTTKVGTWSS